MEDKDYVLLQEEHLDCLITLAFKKMAIEEANEIIKEFDRRESEEEKKSCDRAYAQFLDKLQKIEKEEKRRNNFTRMKKTATRVLQAACILLIVALAAPIAIAKVEPLRSMVLRFLISRDEEQGAANFDMVIEEELAFNVPEGWSGEYYMTYIPEGFEIYDLVEFAAIIEYRNEEGRMLIFSDYTSGTSASTDIENADTWYTTVQGKKAYVISKNGRCTIVWAIDDRFFRVNFDGSYEETLKIAESVRKILPYSN